MYKTRFVKIRLKYGKCSIQFSIGRKFLNIYIRGFNVYRHFSQQMEQFSAKRRGFVFSRTSKDLLTGGYKCKLKTFMKFCSWVSIIWDIQ